MNARINAVDDMVNDKNEENVLDETPDDVLEAAARTGNEKAITSPNGSVPPYIFAQALSGIERCDAVCGFPFQHARLTRFDAFSRTSGEAMRRRDQTSGKAAKTQRRKMLGSRRASKVARGRQPSDANVSETIARLTHERDEALEQQAATAEVLRIIASSPGDLDAALEAILANATRICEAKFGVLHRCQDGAFEARAMVGVPPALAHELRRRALFISPKGAPLDRLLRTKKTIHTVDATKEKVQPPWVILGGARSHIAVPMIKAGEVIGALPIYRTEVRPFTDSQLTLVLNFAAQAVIAIENTRLLTELRQRTDDLGQNRRAADRNFRRA